MAKMALLMYAGNDVEDLHDIIPDLIKPKNIAEDDWTEYAKAKAKVDISC